MDIPTLMRAIQVYRQVDPEIPPQAMLSLLIVARLRDARATDIAHELGISAFSAGRMVSYWESRGYIQREPDPADKRAFNLALTAKGVRLYEELKNI